MAICISIPSAFAEFTPTQPNAVAIYDNTTDELTVNWDFNSLSVDSRCAIKGDFNFNNDANFAPLDVDLHTSYIPSLYSPFGSSPVILGSSSIVAEEISCTGSLTINLGDIVNDSLVSSEINVDDLPSFDMFMSFYILTDEGNYNAQSDYLLDELFLIYAPTITLTSHTIDYVCLGNIGNNLYIDLTGVYTNDGDNCDQYNEVQSFNTTLDTIETSVNIESEEDTFEATLNDISVNIINDSTDGLKEISVTLLENAPSFENLLVDGFISLTWTPPANDGGTPIIDYVVEYKLTSDTDWTVFDDGITANPSAIVTGLINGESYDFRYAATNAVGTGPFSDPVTKTPVVVESIATPIAVNGFYEVTATQSLHEITITIQYTEAEIAGLDESALTIYRFTGGNWIALPTTIDAQNNVATATTPGFSTFALVGAPQSSSSSSETKQGGGGCSGDCTKPTFGKDKDGRQIVQEGFSFNGNATDVTTYWTPYHMITAQTNTTHNFTLKAYENFGVNNIKWFQFGVVPEVGVPLNDAEILTTIYIQSSEIDEIVDSDSNNLFDIVNATSYVENCGYVDTDCLEISLDVMFRDDLKNKVIVIQVMDTSRNTETKYLNDGIDVFGESMNEPLVREVTVSKGGAFYPQTRGTVELTLTSYKDNAWQDVYGYMWSSNNYGFYIVDTVPVPVKEPDLMWNAMTRINSNFDAMKQTEIERAVLIFDSTTLQKDIKPTFTFDIVEKIDKLHDPEVLENMKIEEQKAKVILDKMFR